MASDDIKYKVTLTSDDSETEKEGKKAAKSFIKGVGNNGYIKLGAEITKYKYPKYDPKSYSGSNSVDYRQLQKAQDELISNWKKLSKQGFSSDDDKLFNLLKSWRKYLRAADYQYDAKNPRRSSISVQKELDDKNLARIRDTIGTQINTYFHKLLGKVDIGGRTFRLFHRGRDKFSI